MYVVRCKRFLVTVSQKLRKNVYIAGLYNRLRLPKIEIVVMHVRVMLEKE
jgi:hypothetical protein